MQISRRSFLGGVLALSACAVIPRPLVSAVPMIWGDGVHCDVDGLDAAIHGRPFEMARELLESPVRRVGGGVVISGGRFFITRRLVIRADDVLIDRCDWFSNSDDGVLALSGHRVAVTDNRFCWEPLKHDARGAVFTLEGGRDGTDTEAHSLA